MDNYSRNFYYGIKKGFLRPIDELIKKYVTINWRNFDRFFLKNNLITPQKVEIFLITIRFNFSLFNPFSRNFFTCKRKIVTQQFFIYFLPRKPPKFIHNSPDLSPTASKTRHEWENFLKFSSFYKNFRLTLEIFLSLENSDAGKFLSFSHQKTAVIFNSYPHA